MSIVNRSFNKAKKMESNSFEKKVFNASKAFAGGKENFKTKELPSNQAFQSGKDDVKLKAFADSDKKNHDEKAAFWGTSTKSNLSDKTFAAKDSHMGDRKSHDDKTYHGADRDFHSSNDVVGEHAMEKSKAPKIIKQESPMYTEEQVQRLLNKS